MNYASKVLLHI